MLIKCSGMEEQGRNKRTKFLNYLATTKIINIVQMHKVCHFLYLLAIIALIIAVVLGWNATHKGCHENNKARDVARANFFFYAAIALGVLALFQQGWEASY